MSSVLPAADSIADKALTPSGESSPPAESNQEHPLYSDLMEEELLLEEIFLDAVCGVY